jgi:hypothetical protein
MAVATVAVPTTCYFMTGRRWQGDSPLLLYLIIANGYSVTQHAQVHAADVADTHIITCRQRSQVYCLNEVGVLVYSVVTIMCCESRNIMLIHV